MWPVGQIEASVTHWSHFTLEVDPRFHTGVDPRFLLFFLRVHVFGFWTVVNLGYISLICRSIMLGNAFVSSLYWTEVGGKLLLAALPLHCTKWWWLLSRLKQRSQLAASPVLYGIYFFLQNFWLCRRWEQYFSDFHFTNRFLILWLTFCHKKFCSFSHVSVYNEAELYEINRSSILCLYKMESDHNQLKSKGAYIRFANIQYHHFLCK